MKMIRADKIQPDNTVQFAGFSRLDDDPANDVDLVAGTGNPKSFHPIRRIDHIETSGNEDGHLLVHTDRGECVFIDPKTKVLLVAE